MLFRSIAVRLVDDAVSEANLRGMLTNAQNGAPHTIFENLTDTERNGAVRMIEAALDEFRTFGRADTQALGFIPAETVAVPGPAEPRPFSIDNEVSRIRREAGIDIAERVEVILRRTHENIDPRTAPSRFADALIEAADREPDRKSTRLNSSHT